MRAISKILLVGGLLACSPVLAGNLTFDSGQTTWRTTQCTRPMPPPSVVHANPETRGDAMNTLIAQYNGYVDAMQAYMTCIGNEADHDQVVVNQSIAASAQKEIGEAKQESDRVGEPLRRRSMQ